MNELLMIEQRRGRSDDAPWVVEDGRRVKGHDDNRRLSELQTGLCATPTYARPRRTSRMRTSSGS